MISNNYHTSYFQTAHFLRLNLLIETLLCLSAHLNTQSGFRNTTAGFTLSPSLYTIFRAFVLFQGYTFSQIIIPPFENNVCVEHLIFFNHYIGKKKYSFSIKILLFKLQRSQLKVKKNCQYSVLLVVFSRDFKIVMFKFCIVFSFEISTFKFKNIKLQSRSKI